jgi:hypothetical protein
MSFMPEWYTVRCVFRWLSYPDRPYEERITLWSANSIDEAINLAEDEATDYAASSGFEYLGLAQAYSIGPLDSIESGTEVYSLLRDSGLDPAEYLDQYFQTGAEHTRHLDDGQ